MEKLKLYFWLFRFCCFKLLFDVGFMTWTKADYLYEHFEIFFYGLKILTMILTKRSNLQYMQCILQETIYRKDLFYFTVFIVYFTCCFCIFRSSHRRCSGKKGVLRNFAKLTKKHLCQRFFFNKCAGLRP